MVNPVFRDEAFRGAEKLVFIPAVRVGGGDEKAPDQPGANDRDRAHVYGSKSTIHLVL